MLLSTKMSRGKKLYVSVNLTPTFYPFRISQLFNNPCPSTFHHPLYPDLAPASPPPLTYSSTLQPRDYLIAKEWYLFSPTLIPSPCASKPSTSHLLQHAPTQGLLGCVGMDLFSPALIPSPCASKPSTSHLLQHAPTQGLLGCEGMVFIFAGTYTLTLRRQAPTSHPLQPRDYLIAKEWYLFSPALNKRDLPPQAPRI